MTRRIALVTGSGRGIGRATARALASDHDVVVHYRRDVDAANAVAAELAASGASTLVARAELEDEAELDTLVTRAVERFGRVDTLVANAAAGVFRPVMGTRRDHVERTASTIVASFVQLVQAVTQTMPPGGRIVAVSGTDAAYAVPAHGVIGAAKAALEALVRSFSVELGGRAITVNAVRPGPVRTDSTAAYYRADPDAAAILRAGVPAARFGEPEEVAAVIAFLCSPAAAFVNGAVVPVDGGLSAGGGPWVALHARHDAP